MIKCEIDWNNNGAYDHAYSDITEYLIRADWTLGIRNPENLLAIEGTATLTLNNLSRIFSPSYSGGAIHGKFKHNLRVRIGVYNPTTELYQYVWHGWTDKYSPSPFKTSDLTCTIECVQGLERFITETFTYSIQQNVTADEIISQLFLENSYQSPQSVPSPMIGTCQIGDQITYSSDVITANIDQGTFNYLLVVPDWDSVYSALRDVVEAEQGIFWLGRDGSINFRTRYSIFNDYSPTTFNDLGQYVQEASYSYGAYLYNKARVTYLPKETSSGVTLWTGNKSVVTGSQEIIVNPISSNKEDVYVVGVTNISCSDPNVSVSMKSHDYNSIILLVTSPSDTSVDITVIGNSIVYKDKLTVEKIDSQSIIDNNGVYVKEIDNALIDDEDHANTIAEYILSEYSEATGSFDTLTIYDRDDSWTTRMLDTTLGSLVTITEYQTGDINNPHIVLGEQWDWSPNNLSCQYTLKSLDVYIASKVGSFIIGVSQL